MSVHDDKTLRCTAPLTDEHGEALTVEQPLPEGNETAEVPKRCGTRLTWEEHGRFESSLRGDRRERFESSALVFTCPDCGGETALCPVCSDPDDRSPGGWIDGEASGEQIPCHNCNQQEIAERRRRGVKR